MSNLSKNFLTKSLSTWKRKEAYRRAKWKAAKEGSAERAKWFSSLKVAKAKVALRTKQLQEQTVNDVDKAGLQFITANEIVLDKGIPLKPYNDSQGHATIGIGHLIHLGNVTAADRVRYAHFTEKNAIDLFHNDLKKYIAAVNSVVKRSKVTVNQNMFNALVSLCFNIGEGGFITSTVAKKLIAGDKNGAAEAILLWNKPSEIMGRRRREYNLFKK